MQQQKASAWELMGGEEITEGREDERGQTRSCTKNNLMLSALAVAMEHPRNGQGRLQFASLKFTSDWAASLIAARTRAVRNSLCGQNQLQHSRSTPPGCLGPILPPGSWPPMNYSCAPGCFLLSLNVFFLLPCQVPLLGYCLLRWTFCF